MSIEHVEHTHKIFLDIPAAAQVAGLSIRHFRRVYYEEGNGRFVQIGRKFFVLTKDLQAWLVINRPFKECSNG